MAWLAPDFVHPARAELATGHHLRPIRAADETELLGCVYIDPPGDDSPAGTEAIASWWVVDAHVGGTLDTALAEFVPRWLADTWGFSSVVVDP